MSVSLFSTEVQLRLPLKIVEVPQLWSFVRTSEDGVGGGRPHPAPFARNLTDFRVPSADLIGTRFP
jgi:hypothetical protein